MGVALSCLFCCLFGFCFPPSRFLSSLLFGCVAVFVLGCMCVSALCACVFELVDMCVNAFCTLWHVSKCTVCMCVSALYASVWVHCVHVCVCTLWHVCKCTVCLCVCTYIHACVCMFLLCGMCLSALCACVWVHCMHVCECTVCMCMSVCMYASLPFSLPLHFSSPEPGPILSWRWLYQACLGSATHHLLSHVMIIILTIINSITVATSLILPAFPSKLSFSAWVCIPAFILFYFFSADRDKSAS